MKVSMLQKGKIKTTLLLGIMRAHLSKKLPSGETIFTL